MLGSKRDIVAELLRQAQTSPAAEDLRVRLQSTDDAATWVRLAAGIGRRVYEQMGGGLDLLRGASVLAPELAAAAREVDQRRLAGALQLAKYVAARDQLRAGLTPSTAADLVWAMTGPGLYRNLVLERGWTGNAYERVLGDFLVAALIKSI